MKFGIAFLVFLFIFREVCRGSWNWKNREDLIWTLHCAHQSFYLLHKKLDWIKRRRRRFHVVFITEIMRKKFPPNPPVMQSKVMLVLWRKSFINSASFSPSPLLQKANLEGLFASRDFRQKGQLMWTLQDFLSIYFKTFYDSYLWRHEIAWTLFYGRLPPKAVRHFLSIPLESLNVVLIAIEEVNFASCLLDAWVKVQHLEKCSCSTLSHTND